MTINVELLLAIQKNGERVKAKQDGALSQEQRNALGEAIG